MKKWILHLVGYTVVAGIFFYAGALTRDYLVKKEARDERARPARFVNKPAPRVVSTTVDLNPWKLSEQKGKVVVLEFWSISCPPCVSSVPTFKRLYDQFKDRPDFALFGVSFDGDEIQKMRRFCDSHSMTWVQLVEPKREWNNAVAQAFEVVEIPTTCVIDKDGIVRVYDHFPSNLESVVKALLDRPNQTPSHPAGGSS